MKRPTIVLTDFVLARLAEDEAAAIRIRDDSHFYGVEATTEEEVLYFSDPSRVLADIELKRKVVEQCVATSNMYELDGDHDFRDISGVYLEMVYGLASLYSKHPEYLADEWAEEWPDQDADDAYDTEEPDDGYFANAVAEFLGEK